MSNHIEEAENRIIGSAKAMDSILSLLDSLYYIGSNMIGQNHEKDSVKWASGVSMLREVVYKKQSEMMRGLLYLSGVGSGKPDEYAKEVLERILDGNYDTIDNFVETFIDPGPYSDINLLKEVMKEKLKEKK